MSTKMDETNWECIMCGMFNKPNSDACSRCYTNKYEATQKVAHKKYMCPECGHRHAEGICCHMLVDAGTLGDMVLDESEESESVDDDDFLSESSSDDDDEEELLLKNLTDKKTGFAFIADKADEAEKNEKKKLLHTPDFARRIGYARCNCRVGIPFHSSRYERVPLNMFIGGLRVMQYDDIMRFYGAEEPTPHKPKKHLNRAEEEALRQAKLEAEERLRQTQIDLLPLVLPFIPFSQISPTAIAGRGWHIGVNAYGEYRDVRDCVPWTVLKPHTGFTEALYLHNNKHLFSSGDKRLLVTDVETGATVCTLTRDTTSLTQLLVYNSALICCSGNGSIRFFPFAYDIRRMKLENTVWQHTNSVTAIILASPQLGCCKRHGMETHTCFLYTASEDRSLGVWDSVTGLLVHQVKNHVIKRYTYQSLTQSDYHLLAGTSGGLIMIFTKLNHCDREDTHACSVPGADKTYCLQLCLRLPAVKSLSGHDPSVLSLLCCGPNYYRTLLFAGDNTGQLTVWTVPETGLGYEPLRASLVHTGALRCMATTWKHLITGGDDGRLVLHDLTSLSQIRVIDIAVAAFDKGLITNPEIPRRIKSLAVAENFETGGSMVIGTSLGEVFISSIGTFM